MNTIPEAITPAVPEAETNFATTVFAMICGLGILVFVCMATSGLDMSVGFF